MVEGSMNRYLRAAILVLGLAPDSLGSVAAAQTMLTQQLIGTWNLVSVDAERADGSRTALFGPNPKGVLMFANDGHFTLVTVRADLPKLASSNRARTTPEEAQAVVAGSIAYFGRYAVDDATKVLTVNI